MQPLALTLTTVPPEILLQIVAQLPTTSLHALSLTSRTLSGFLQTHASTICNTYIQQNHSHSRAASILKSRYVDGWLVPKHSCIVEAEEQWQNELASRSASRASSPHYRGVNARGCCFRTGTSGSGSSNDRAPRPRIRRQSPPSLLTRDKFQHAPPCSSSYQPLLSPVTRHTDPSLSLALGLPSPFKLSRPGPHYLVFLERYSAEIVARSEMDTPQLRPNSDVQSDEEHGSEKDIQFEFMLKLYCLRNWMVLCHNTFITGDGNGVPYAHISHQETEAAGPSTVELFIDDMRETFKNVVKKGKTGVQKVLRNLKRPKAAPPARRLLFGEIDSDSASSLISGRTLSQKDSSSTAIERDHWVKSLLWFYGVSGQFLTFGAEKQIFGQREEIPATKEEFTAETTPNDLDLDIVASGRISRRRTKFSEELAHRSQKMKSSWRAVASRYKGKFERLEET